MELEREQLIEGGVAAGGVGLMFVMLYFIGATHSEAGELTAAGGTLLVYAIVAFVIVMGGAGVALAYTISDPE